MFLVRGACLFFRLCPVRLKHAQVRHVEAAGPILADLGEKEIIVEVLDVFEEEQPRVFPH